jgi:ElaB/YqjD/DUF883 family membrane-anchored ribosome-binding protein
LEDRLWRRYGYTGVTEIDAETARALRELRQEPGDVRFQFEVIKQLAESIRQMQGQLGKVVDTQTQMLERLIRLEADKVSELVAELRSDVGAIRDRVDRLESDFDQRTGAAALLASTRNWLPLVVTAIGAMGTLIFFILRAIGVIQMPPTSTVPAVPQHQAYVFPPRDSEERKQ